jgi:formylglycine-generating enzyme required for sulfatase activity
MKTKLHALLAGLILGAGLYPALAQPALGIVQTNNQSLLYWPANATGFVLQSTTNLTAPNWTLANDAIPTTYGLQTAAIVSNTSTARFFRLLFQNNFTADGMALVPAGSFTIGDTLDGESDAIPTNVYVSAFYMDTNLVSYGQWQTNYNYAISIGYGFDNAGYGKAANHPVTYINWYDCVKWCNARSQQAGLTPVYYTDAAMTMLYTNGDTDTVYPNWTNNGYRLPTEAEWEKAARGGLSGQRFPWGLTISESQANYDGDTSYFYDLGPNGLNTNFNTGSPPFSSPVGYFAANGYGLYDMAGNVHEWCWDWNGISYAGGTDPRGPASGSGRIVRGGDWDSGPDDARCATRDFIGPSSTLSYWGFRCVRKVPNATTSDGMALIPAGSFIIGNSVGDTDSGISDAFPTNVYVSAFYMDTNLVSYSYWQTIYTYATSIGYVFDNASSGKGANYPVGTVYWYDALKWCNARSQQAGLTPVYYTDAGMTLLYTNGDTDAVYPNWVANGYRLPTEAEWEKAARGGLSAQRFPWGATISESQANYRGNTNFSFDLGPNGDNTNFDTMGYPFSSPVAYFAPNGYGLYDMAGNVFEWCWDWYANPPYPAGSPYLGGSDPRGPASSPNATRVVRGDDCYDDGARARCAARDSSIPEAAYSNILIGFRCVRKF